MTVEFCLPAYNEEQILEKNALKLLDYCRGAAFPFAWQVAVVVNGSSDRSAAIARDLERLYPGEVVAVEYAEGGRGQALKRRWLESQADVLAYMDVDLAVSLDCLPGLVEPILSGVAEAVIGSRLLAASKIERSLIREASSQGYNLLSRLILGHRFSDLQCGFKAIRREAFLKIAPYLLDPGWFFDTELLVFARRAGFRVEELAVDWSEDRYDRRQSKVRLVRDTVRFLRSSLKLRRRLGKTAPKA